MKKLLLSLGLILAAPTWAISDLPEGSYKGTGHRKSPEGKSGTYQVEVSAGQGLLNAHYDFDGKTRSFQFKMKADKQGVLEVWQGETNLGAGYCIGIQCHYGVTVGGFTMEETLTFYENHLYRLGSKTEHGEKVFWVESLDKIREKTTDNSINNPTDKPR